jgi:hypothetical protein
VQRISPQRSLYVDKKDHADSLEFEANDQGRTIVTIKDGEEAVATALVEFE